MRNKANSPRREGERSSGDARPTKRQIMRNEANPGQPGWRPRGDGAKQTQFGGVERAKQSQFRGLVQFPASQGNTSGTWPVPWVASSSAAWRWLPLWGGRLALACRGQAARDSRARGPRHERARPGWPRHVRPSPRPSALTMPPAQRSDAKRKCFARREL